MSMKAAAIDPLQPLLVSKQQAAKVLGICVRTVEYLAVEKKLRTCKIGRRTLVVYASLRSFARRGTSIVGK